MSHLDTPQFRAMVNSGDFAMTPGGLRRKELVHLMKPDEAVTTRQGLSKTINRRSKAATDLVSAPAIGAQTPPPRDGWISYAAWTEDAVNVITWMSTTWTVPPAPQIAEEELIYLFNGLQDVGSSFILQPVLTWGVSPDGGGRFWSVASWYVDNAGHAFKSPSANVNVGDTLTGVMTLTGQSGQTFNYSCQFTGIAGTELHVVGITQLVMPVITL